MPELRKFCSSGHAPLGWGPDHPLAGPHPTLAPACPPAGPLYLYVSTGNHSSPLHGGPATTVPRDVQNSTSPPCPTAYSMPRFQPSQSRAGRRPMCPRRAPSLPGQRTLAAALSSVSDVHSGGALSASYSRRWATNCLKGKRGGIFCKAWLFRLFRAPGGSRGRGLPYDGSRTPGLGLSGLD